MEEEEDDGFCDGKDEWMMKEGRCLHFVRPFFSVMVHHRTTMIGVRVCVCVCDANTSHAQHTTWKLFFFVRCSFQFTVVTKRYLCVGMKHDAWCASWWNGTAWSKACQSASVYLMLGQLCVCVCVCVSHNTQGKNHKAYQKRWRSRKNVFLCCTRCRWIYTYHDMTTPIW